MCNNTVDVLIVGAGPVGTTLAIDLFRRGLSFRIIDKAPSSFDGSRAKGIQPRTLEVMQDLGVLPDILEKSTNYPLLGVHLGPFTIPWRMMSDGPRTSDIPFPNIQLIPQFHVDGALHARLKSMGHTVEFDTELTNITQDNEKVTVTVSTPKGSEEIFALYVVGSDGGASPVRRITDIGFTGTTHEEDRMIIVDAPTTGLSKDRWHIWPGKSGQFIAACPLPHSDLFQWIIRLSPEEQPNLELSALNSRIQKRIRNPKIVMHDMQWTSVFRPNIRLADHYRVGRIFLAGDAAHCHTPAGAQGLNTGIQDSYNLGWKLEQVLAGADSSLLDSYEAERQPIAAAMLKFSTKKYEGIAKLDPASFRRGKDEKQLLLTYRSGPLVDNSSAKTKTLRAGDRAPDAELRSADGSIGRLYENFIGPHFTAIAYGKEAVFALTKLKWPAIGTPLRSICIDVPDDEKVGATFSDVSNTFKKAYGLTTDTLLLIRPDGYIGHIAVESMALTTQRVISELTPSRK
jgi:2-polyprenyl-6-methoxyphenol hydroxylase-like FAD-dependent oxidoreductase